MIQTSRVGSTSMCPERYFFLHIPKTAGTSLREYIHDQFDPDAICPFSGASAHALLAELSSVRQGYQYYEGHYTYDLMRQVIGCDPTTITMLRDPIEQVLSYYSFLPVIARSPWESSVRSPDPHAPILRLGKEIDILRPLTMPIDAYFAQPSDQIAALFDNMQTRYIASKSELVWASSVVDGLGATLPSDAPEELGPNLAEAKRRLDRFAVVGITERFRASVALLAYTFDWQPIREVRVRNVTEGRIRRDHLAPRTVTRIREINAMDYALYGHARRVFDERYHAMEDDLTRRFGGHATEGAGLDDLMERHYAQRFAQRHPIALQMHIDFTQPINAAGWHTIERTEDHGRARWTGPGTTASIDAPIAPDRDIRVAFRVLAALAPDILDGVTLRVNDVSIPLSRERDTAEATIFAGTVGRQTLANGKPFARVAIGTPRTIRPVDLDPASSDDRPLGVLVNWINLEPAHARMIGPTS